MSANLIAALLIAVLAIVLTLQNAQSVTVHLFLWKVEASLILLLALNFAAGALLVYLLMLLQVRSLRKTVRKLEKAIKEKPVAPVAPRPN
jgi:uncharacterized integral membrane protein